jgi:hypothetical protein
MPTILTSSGVSVIFDPSAIFALAETDADSGDEVTCVYGILPAAIQIKDKVGDFLASLGIAGKFSQLTRPDGSKIWIRGNAVTYLTPPVSGDSPDSVNTIVGIGSFTQGIREDAGSAKAAINSSRDQDSRL